MEKYKNEINDLENPQALVAISAKEKIEPSLSKRIDDEIVTGLFDPNRIDGFPTGYRSIDKIVDGLKVGSLTVLVASTGMGKSILAMNILVHLNRDHKMPVVYIDLENGTLETTERLIKIWQGDNLPTDFFKDPKYKEDVVKMRDEFKTFHYYSHDDLNTVSRSVISRLVRYHAQKGVKVFLIDPLECIPADDVFDKQREEGLVVRELKNIAQEENVAIIICHHFRKTSSSGRDTFVGSIADVDSPKVRIPTLDDMRGTSEIGDASTGVWALVRLNGSDGKESEDRALFRVLKNRFGRLGDTYLIFSSYPLGFRELTTLEYIDMVEEKTDRKIKRKKKAEDEKKIDSDSNILGEEIPNLDTLDLSTI